MQFFRLINFSHVPLFSFYKINELTSERINLLINWLLFVICAGKCISETLNITRAELRITNNFVLSVCCCVRGLASLCYQEYSYSYGGVNCLNCVPYRCYTYV